MHAYIDSGDRQRWGGRLLRRIAVLDKRCCHRNLFHRRRAAPGAGRCGAASNTSTGRLVVRAKEAHTGSEAMATSLSWHNTWLGQAIEGIIAGFALVRADISSRTAITAPATIDYFQKSTLPYVTQHTTVHRYIGKDYCLRGGRSAPQSLDM
ncbi:hypothetical protein L226DRAFT_536417 [Lentinus tigrinus ALCF2SS1-7]|uniref:uncharacterized protein n=1 Tax=Lentinus tigrinus ALCF2SS1-7 TaxID=1328758 RepID=UPI0011662463|nr:hypothetical protein L226DRAFT_536417 [Lentinus tigrinus ALCF2SS1-7]